VPTLSCRLVLELRFQLSKMTNRVFDVVSDVAKVACDILDARGSRRREGFTYEFVRLAQIVAKGFYFLRGQHVIRSEGGAGVITLWVKVRVF
jgi:hypothetical protein